MKIALIAHDKRKMIWFRLHTHIKPIFEQHELFATGTTGLRIMEATGLVVTRYQSGPLGGEIKKLVQ